MVYNLTSSDNGDGMQIAITWLDVYALYLELPTTTVQSVRYYSKTYVYNEMVSRELGQKKYETERFDEEVIFLT